MPELSNRQKGLLFLAGGLLCFLAAFALIWGFTGQWKDREPTTQAGSALPLMDPVETERSLVGMNAEKEAEPWVIYITGAVRVPGIYKVPAGSRIYEVVNRAGGLTSEADPVAVNLARPLQDGDHIHVPRHGEKPREAAVETSQSTSDGSGVVTVVEAGSARIDLNHASASKLESLPGIGPKTAAAIVLFRQEHGLFRSIEDLVQVRGIGPAKMDQIRGLVTVRP